VYVGSSPTISTIIVIKIFILKYINMIIGIIIILVIGIIVGLIFNNSIVGFFTVGGLIVLWGIWGMIQSWINFHKKNEKDNS